MKYKILTVLLVLAVIASCITGCTQKNSYLIQVMKLAPEDTCSIVCTDIEALAEDPDFEFMHDNLDEIGWETVGIDVSDITGSISFETEWDSILVLIGNFNLKNIRNARIEQDFIEGEYRGVEIWTNDFEYAMAFVDNMIVSGDSDEVEACIRVYKNEESSMYDNKEMKSVADRLPSGVISAMFGPDYMDDIEILAGGICLHNLTSGDGVCDITGWFKFDSEASAITAIEEGFEDDISMDLDFTIVDAHLRDQFIEITGEREIPD